MLSSLWNKVTKHKEKKVYHAPARRYIAYCGNDCTFCPHTNTIVLRAAWATPARTQEFKTTPPTNTKVSIGNIVVQVYLL
jgi:hypothetical protein